MDKIKISKDLPNNKGIPLARCAIYDLVRKIDGENHRLGYNMEVEADIRRVLVLAYELGKATTRQYYKSRGYCLLKTKLK